MVQRWTDSILQLAESNIPNRLVIVRQDDKPWFNIELRRLLRKKKRAHNDAKKYNNPRYGTKFGKIKNNYINLCTKQKKQHEKNIIEKLIEEGGNNAKKYWKLLKILSGKNELQEIPPILFDNQIIFNDKDKTEIFNNYFNKISSLNTGNVPDLDFDNIISHQEFELNFNITEDEVESK